MITGATIFVVLAGLPIGYILISWLIDSIINRMHRNHDGPNEEFDKQQESTTDDTFSGNDPKHGIKNSSQNT